MQGTIYEKLKGRQASVMGHQDLRKSAVLLPLLEIDGEVRILFEERSHQLRSQPGDICFPGGRIDVSDANPQSAAIRETCEELGVTAEQVEIIAPLDYLVSHVQIVYPFVGRIQIDDPSVLKPNPDEVESLFSVPLDFLLRAEPDIHYVEMKATPPDDFPYDQIAQGRNYKWRTTQLPQYFYHYQDRVIWGLTAKILRHFLALVKQA